MTATAVEAPRAIPHDRVLVVFSGLLLVMLLAALDSTIVATALPTIVGELGGLEHLSWVVTAYLLAQTVVTPLYGKLGDLHGRKGVLQGAIVLFLAGSALCGMSRNMLQLILFRAIQGLGGGGLTVTTQAVIGDIVSPRERGRYQGIFGAVFGVASIAGPLLGGFFTTRLSWRWIFYVNIPLGLIAMAVLAITLPSLQERVNRAIDYLGSGLLAVALSAIVLFTDLGGAAFAWNSTVVIGLIALAVVGLALFLLVERRAAEPVLPLRLFGNRVFSVTSAIGLIVGFALFGSVTYLPLYLQVVKGASPTASGLELLPMMGGMLVTSIISGQLISRWGRYRLFPIAGTAVMAGGLLLLSRMGAGSGMLAISFSMLVLGAGLGMVMQVLVLAVQNAVDYSDLGVATSGATLFRLIGGSLGTALFGAIFAGRLVAVLARTLPAGAAGAADISARISPEALARLTPELRAVYVHAFTVSLGTVFIVAAAIALLAFAFSLLLPERPLRETVPSASSGVGEAFAMPTDTDSLTQISHGLSLLLDKDTLRRGIERIVARAGVDLRPSAAWLLFRIDRDPAVDPDALARAHNVDPARVAAGLAQLRERGLVQEEPGVAGGPPSREITLPGREILARLVDARREGLGELLAAWSPDQHEELARMLGHVARELAADARL